LVELSRFTDCYKAGIGSCILIYNTNTDFVFANSFSLRNYITKWNNGLVIYSFIGSNTSYNLNYILYSSFAYSDPKTYTSDVTVYLKYGISRVISTNSSHNTCHCDSAFLIDAASHSLTSNPYYSNDDSYIHFCSISNNYATNIATLFFNYNQQRVEKTNVINNSEMSTSYGIVHNGEAKTVTINDCCFVKNNGNGNGYLFRGIMTINNCFIQDDFKTFGDVNTNNIATTDACYYMNVGAALVYVKCHKTVCKHSISKYLKLITLSISIISP
jgi:hypothetical protein